MYVEYTLFLYWSNSDICVKHFFWLLIKHCIFIPWCWFIRLKQNVTLDDTNLFITYSPSTSWHASTVSCSSCLAPDTAFAHAGTWHDGTHIVPTTDEDDEGANGVPDNDGDGSANTLSSATTTSTSASSVSSPSITGNVNSNNDNDGDDDNGDSHKGKGGSKTSFQRRVDFFTYHKS